MRRSSWRLTSVLLLGACQPSPPPGEEDPCNFQGDQLPPEDLEEVVAFDLWQDGTQTHYEWLAEAGDEVRCTYVECDRERIELEFEEQGGGPRLTLQVCGYGRTTAFEPVSPASFPDCEDDVVGVVIEWENGDSFVSAAAATPCTLHVSKTEVSVTGSFECADLAGANGSVRISTGTFSCAAEI